MGSALPILDDPPAYEPQGSDTFNVKIPIIPGPIVETFTIATEAATPSATPSQSISNEDIVILYDASADAVDNCHIILQQMVCQTNCDTFSHANSNCMLHTG